MSFYNDKSRVIDEATMLGMWANQSGPWANDKKSRIINKGTMMGMWANQSGSRRSGAKIQDVLKRGNFCKKWLQAVSAGDITAQETLISALAQQLGSTKTIARDILIRECRKSLPTGPLAEEWCRYFEQRRQQAEAFGNFNVIQELFAYFAMQYGISQAEASDWFKRNCDRPSNGDSTTSINWADWCKKYLYYMSINDTASIQSLYSAYSQATGETNLSLISQLFQRNCGSGHSDTTTETETETADDCRITCYKCVNGNNVANRFDPIKSSKANGRGYNYDCPTGWTVKPDPCKTPIRDVNGSNSNNNTITPIRDTDFNTSTSSNGSSNNNTILPIRDTNNTINSSSSSSSSSGTNFGTATPNRGLFFSGGI